MVNSSATRRLVGTAVNLMSFEDGLFPLVTSINSKIHLENNKLTYYPFGGKSVHRDIYNHLNCRVYFCASCVYFVYVSSEWTWFVVKPVVAASINEALHYH